ncbi:hypothetical protein [Nocardia noduli]|uniref:hypothetical protein n=1 Tax=Nocardia noduli TaxID=2815722 RepID=UPI001C248647|nr:hypothetical protein [Nocardia noduli]
MNRPRTAARHVVVYCDGCGDVYAEHEDEGIVFDSIAQLLSNVGADMRRAGWVFDGDQVLCDGCAADERCEQAGHHSVPPDADYCHVCGIDIDKINGENQS